MGAANVMMSPPPHRSARVVKLGCILPGRFLFLPCPWVQSDDMVRVYAADVGPDEVGRVRYFDLDARDPRRVVGESRHVVLDVGVPGAFDDNGITPMCIVPLPDRLRLYYTGWQLSDKVRYFMFTGLAESFDGGETFIRVRRTPVLERNDAELICRTAAFVMPDQGGYRAWYIGGSDTVVIHGKQLPTYSLHYAESADGIQWGPGREIMAPRRPHEFGFGRPWVRHGAGGYEMWYSIRHADVGYRIAHATSADGLNWTRRDSGGVAVGEAGWDSEMTAFGAVFDTPSGTYMLYNGNGYGRTGIGLARVERETPPPRFHDRASNRKVHTP